MNINCTVIIQICNFFLAWLILENILLRPLLQKLVLKKKSDADFLDSIEKIRQTIEQLEYNQKEQWQKFNQFSLQNIPSLKNSRTLPSSQEHHYNDEVDNQKVEALCESYTPRIIQWVKEAQ